MRRNTCSYSPVDIMLDPNISLGSSSVNNNTSSRLSSCFVATTPQRSFSNYPDEWERKWKREDDEGKLDSQLVIISSSSSIANCRSLFFFWWMDRSIFLCRSFFINFLDCALFFCFYVRSSYLFRYQIIYTYLE
jgi:hypothetical protein